VSQPAPQVVHGSGCASERSLIVAAAFDKGRSHKHVLDDELEIRFQEAHGAHQFREGKPRALLEVKRPQISTAIYEARLLEAMTGRQRLPEIILLWRERSDRTRD
jgi:hypothetical protein